MAEMSADTLDNGLRTVREHVHSGGHLSSLLTPHPLAAQMLWLLQDLSARISLSTGCPSSGLVYVHRRGSDVICGQAAWDNLRGRCYRSFFFP
jgi:hypothetical protein